jgi:hypothetical protein
MVIPILDQTMSQSRLLDLEVLRGGDEEHLNGETSLVTMSCIIIMYITRNYHRCEGNLSSHLLLV